MQGNLSFTDLDIAATGGGLIGVGSGPAMPASGFQLNVTTGTIDALNGPAVDLDPLTAGISLATITSVNSPTSGIALTNISGTFSAGGGSSITGAVGDSFLIDGGTVSSTYQGNITHTTGNAAVRVQNGHGTGTVVFDTGTVSATNGLGLQFNNADGNYDFNGTTTLNGGDAGVDIENGSSGTFDFVAAVAITHAGAGPGFRINNSAATVDHNGTINDSNGLAVDIVTLLAGGSARFDGTVTASGSGLRMNGAAGTVSFANADLSNTATVDIDNNTAVITFTDLDLNQTAGAVNAFDVNTGSANVTTTLTGNGLNSSTPNRLVNITGRAGGTVSFNGTATLQGTMGNTGINISGSANPNNVTFNAPVDLGTSAANRITGGGVSMTGNVANSVVQFNSLDIFTSAIPGISATGSGVLDTATLAGLVNINTTGNGAPALDLDGIVANIVIDGATCNTNGNCVDLTNLAATSVSRLAGVNLTCSAGNCFNGNAARTVEVTGAGNTIAATGAVGLNLTNTTIGANNAVFQSISSSGAANGIVLNNTGSTGNLHVTGSGSTVIGAATGGTIQNTTGVGVSWTSTMGPILNNVTINNTGNHGILGTTVNGFELRNSLVEDAGNADEEHGLHFINLTGTSTVDNSTINRAANDLMQIRNTNADATVTISNSNFPETDGSGGLFGNDALSLQVQGSSNVTLNVNANAFGDHTGSAVSLFGNAIDIGNSTGGMVAATGTVTVNADNNTSDQNPADLNKSGSFKISGQDSMTINMLWTRNTFTGAKGNGVIAIDANDSSTVQGTIGGVGVGNSISNATNSNGIVILGDESSTVTVVVASNTVTNVGTDGIQIANFGSTLGQPTDMDITLTNNIINGHNGGAAPFLAGIDIFGGGDAGGGLCIAFVNNSVSGTPGGFFDFSLDDFGAPNAMLVQGPGVAAVTVADIRTLNSQPAANVGLFGNINFSNGVACDAPP